VLLLDSDGKERVRLEGYLPNSDFTAALMNGLGRLAFVRKKYADAERWYADVVSRYGNTHFGAEAMYWQAVSQYSASHDHTVLAKVAEELRRTFPSSVWASRAIPWLH
jgi:TolA-binding protein